jgi:metal-dependent amidase/aminoacylase/carboxypeptidase family protein
LTFGSIHGGNRNNIIPDEVVLEGTIRTLDEPTRESVFTMIRQTMQGCTSGSGAQYEFIRGSTQYPVTYNDPELTRRNLAGLQRVMGAENVVLSRATMGAEDFSFYQKVVPGFFWFLGTANASKGITGAHHTAEFDIDEGVLPVGVRAAAAQILDYLSR